MLCLLSKQNYSSVERCMMSTKKSLCKTFTPVERNDCQYLEGGHLYCHTSSFRDLTHLEYKEEQQISGFRKCANISDSVKVKIRYTEINIMETLGYKSNCRQYDGDRKKA